MSAARTPARISRRILVFLFVLDGAYVLNCLSPYLGLKFENSQAMYSQLDARARNHFVLPSLAGFGRDAYVRDVRVEVPHELDDEAAGLQWLIRVANRSGRSIHLPFFEHHFARLCGNPPDAVIRFQYTTGDGAVTRVEDVCADPTLRDPFPISLFPACDPECYGELELWASGRWREEPDGSAP